MHRGNYHKSSFVQNKHLLLAGFDPAYLSFPKRSPLAEVGENKNTFLEYPENFIHQLCNPSKVTKIKTLTKQLSIILRLKLFKKRSCPYILVGVNSFGIKAKMQEQAGAGWGM